MSQIITDSQRLNINTQLKILLVLDSIIHVGQKWGWVVGFGSPAIDETRSQAARADALVPRKNTRCA